METPQDETRYPAGYEHIQRRVDDTQRQLRAIDRQIEATGPNSKPIPTPPPPPGLGGTKHFFNADKTLAFLTGQRAEIQAEAWRSIEKETSKTNDPIAAQARDIARQELFPNHFRDMSQAERVAQRGQVKDLDTSQNYADTARLTKAAERASSPAPATPSHRSMSDRFSASLGLTKLMTNAKDMLVKELSEPPAKGKEKEPEKE